MSDNLWRRSIRVACWCAVAGAAHGATTNLVPVADVYLRNNSPDSNSGGGSTLLVGVNNSGSVLNHALLRFSLAGIPTNAAITGASLALISVGGVSSAHNFDLRRLLRDWNEAEATWNTRLAPATAWAAGGGLAGTDFSATASDVATIDAAPAVNTFSSAAMAADVQLWLTNSAANFGWIVFASGEAAASGEQLGSRENAGNEPVLTVDYTVPAAPVPPVISNVQVAGGRMQFSFAAESNRSYTVEFSGAVSPASWNPLTNYAAAPTDTNFVASDALTASNRFYRIWTP